MRTKTLVSSQVAQVGETWAKVDIYGLNLSGSAEVVVFMPTPKGIERIPLGSFPKSTVFGQWPHLQTRDGPIKYFETLTQGLPVKRVAITNGDVHYLARLPFIHHRDRRFETLTINVPELNGTDQVVQKPKVIGTFDSPPAPGTPVNVQIETIFPFTRSNGSLSLTDRKRHFPIDRPKGRTAWDRWEQGFPCSLRQFSSPAWSHVVAGVENSYFDDIIDDLTAGLIPGNKDFPHLSRLPELTPGAYHGYSGKKSFVTVGGKRRTLWIFDAKKGRKIYLIHAQEDAAMFVFHAMHDNVDTEADARDYCLLWLLRETPYRVDRPQTLNGDSRAQYVHLGAWNERFDSYLAGVGLDG